MRIDEAGRDDQAASVDNFRGALGHAANLGDFAVGEREVRAEARGAGAIDDSAAFYNDVIRHDLASLTLRC